MKTVIEMAREAGLGEMGRRTGFVFFQPGTDGLERFAEIVRAAEREACAKECKFGRSSADIEQAIRARSNT